MQLWNLLETITIVYNMGRSSVVLLNIITLTQLGMYIHINTLTADVQ